MCFIIYIEKKTFDDNYFSQFDWKEKRKKIRANFKKGLTEFIHWFRENKETVAGWREEFIPPDILNDIKVPDENDNNASNKNSNQLIEQEMNDIDQNPYDETPTWMRIATHTQKAKSVSIESDDNHNSTISIPLNYVTCKYKEHQIAEASLRAFEMINTSSFTPQDAELVDQHPLFTFYIHSSHQLWWWLIEVACACFCVSGANVASERTFGTIKAMIDPTQNQLNVSTVKDMIILRESLISENTNTELNKKYATLLPNLFNLFLGKTPLRDDQIIIENHQWFVEENEKFKEKSGNVIYYYIYVIC